MHEHLDQVALINANARLYDPYLARSLSVVPYIQDPTNPQNFNRYSYCLNNPLKYTDPSGEKWWHWVLGASMLLDPMSTLVSMCATATCPFVSVTTVSAMGMTPYHGTLLSMSIPSNHYLDKIKNALQIDTYMFRSNNFWHWNSRFLWEFLQSGIGNMYSHVRNILGNVDRVDYFDGATYCTNGNSNKNDGITLGNYINININDEINTNFETYLKTSHNGLFMHEYGHTIQGRRYGLAYLFSIGIPSLRSDKNSGPHPLYKSTHCAKWFEMEASTYAKNYFGADWNNIPNINFYHPTY